MDLKPFGTHECVMCGYREPPMMRYCPYEHHREPPFAAVGWRGDDYRPHLHVTCSRCSYEWLTQTKQTHVDSEIERARMLSKWKPSATIDTHEQEKEKA